MLNFKKKKPISNILFFYSDNVLKKDFYGKLSNSFPKEEDAVNEPRFFLNLRIRIRRENSKKFMSIGTILVFDDYFRFRGKENYRSHCAFKNP